ncbi:MAG: ribose 5-phosphate isomerase B [Lachnospiraceae bacterium]
MLAIGSDHGGYLLKQEIMKHLKAEGKEFTDVGCYDEKSVDYPVYAKKVTEKIQDGSCELGILVCGTGIGMSMAANKEKGIRAAAVSDCYSAEKTREHNNANVLCLGGRTIGPDLACKIVDCFLSTPFSGEERHVRRISMWDK